MRRCSAACLALVRQVMETVPDLPSRGILARGRRWKRLGSLPRVQPNGTVGMPRANSARGLLAQEKRADPLGIPDIQTSPYGSWWGLAGARDGALEGGLGGDGPVVSGTARQQPRVAIAGGTAGVRWRRGFNTSTAV
jgi:hypothetical protein